MTRSAFRFLMILTAGVAAGIGYARAFSDMPWVPGADALAKEREMRERRDEVVGIEEETRASAIDEQRLMELVGQNAIVIDTRMPEQFEEGHLDAPTIINAYPEMMFEQAMPTPDAVTVIEGLAPDRVLERPIVIYCNSTECDLADLVFHELQQQYGYGPEGLVRMYIYHAGWRGIEEHHLPTASGPGRWMEPWEFEEQQRLEGAEEPGDDG